MESGLQPLTPVLAQTVPFPGWGRLYVEQFVGDLLPFLTVAGLFYLVFYVFLPRLFLHRKIQEASPITAEVRREILLSVQSVAIFAASGVSVIALYREGWTQLYTRVETYGWPYFFFSILILVLIQDTWFYWTHRLLHSRHVFKWVHYVHHLSHNPTPWAALAFHPIEALIEAIIFLLVVLFIPVHPLAGGIWLLYMFFMTAHGHLGFETMPKGFARHWLFRWYTTSTHHNLHHTSPQTNYGLYFTVWDRLMGTNHADYEKLHDEVTGAREKSNCSAKEKTAKSRRAKTATAR